jgi:hypothetical protein
MPILVVSDPESAPNVRIRPDLDPQHWPQLQWAKTSIDLSEEMAYYTVLYKVQIKVQTSSLEGLRSFQRHTVHNADRQDLKISNRFFLYDDGEIGAQCV